MFLYVVEDSDITKSYLKNIYKALLKRRANRVRVPIEFKAIENSLTYPEIRTVMPNSRDYQELTAKYYRDSIVGMEILKSFNIKGEDIPLTEDALRLDRRDIMIQYTRNKFDDSCDIEVSEINSNNHFGSIFHFIPKNLNALREKAKELGLDITTKKELRENLEHTPAKFEDNPPRIIWGDFVVNIPNDSIELSACRIAFGKKPGELISWDEVADEYDGAFAGAKGTTQRSVYDTFLRINKRIIEKTRRPLFKTGKLSSIRLS